MKIYINPYPTPTSPSALVAELRQQRLEMLELESSLSTLEGRLDALLAALDRLDPETATCR